MINDPAFYRTHEIEVRLNAVVERVELQNKQLHTRSSDEIGFDKLLIATGARVRKLDLPGATLDGVLYLRWLEDSQRIRAQAEAARRAVVIGVGFIGLEVASVLAQKGLETTVNLPFAGIARLDKVEPLRVLVIIPSRFWL